MSAFAELLTFLGDTHLKLAGFADGLSAEELRWRDSAEEFSVVENICHLRDLEMQGYTPRIARILTESEPSLPDFDGARVAAEGDYNAEDPSSALEVFRTARGGNVLKLQNATPDELDRAGTMEGVGRITLEHLAEMMRSHDEGHLEDLRVLRQRLEKRRQLQATMV
jgi:hypothetical protein